MAAAWAITWSLGWTAFSLLWRAVGPGPLPPNGEWILFLRSWMMFFGIGGAWAGFVYANVLATGERRTPFEQLHAGRVGLWGVLGGASFAAMIHTGWLPVLGSYSIGLEEYLSCAVAGGLSALAMLHLARRGAARPAELLSPGVPEEWSARMRAAEQVRRAT